ncbi:MAG: hypothetical protein PHH26_06290 [Candidatus Thermoplasmatota archaeon]|nr:hypothetical protein [Candidatus Thermoplasmatota archaeon]
MKLRFLYVWPCLLVAFILVIGVATWAWTDTLDTSSSPVQVSSKGAVTATLSSKGDMVTVRDNAGNVVWRHTVDKTYNRIAMSNDGNYIATVGGGVSVLRVPEQRVIWRWDQDGNKAVAITPDGQWLAAGGYAGAVYLFSKDSSIPAKIWPLDANDDSPKSVAISDDGQMIAAAVTGKVYLFSANSGPMIWVAKAEGVNELYMSADGRYVLGVAPYALYFWDKYSSSKIVWQKTYETSVIGAAMNLNGDEIAVSHVGGVTVLNGKGEELRSFAANFKNSDIAMSSDGKFIYANDGAGRLYAFDDTYNYNELRPYRILTGINVGSQRAYVATTALGNWFTYPKGNQLTVERAKPAVIAMNSGAPIITKDQSYDISTFVTNPDSATQVLTLKATMSLPSSINWFKSLAAKVSGEPQAVRSKLLDYAAIMDQDNMVVHTEALVLPAGSSQKIDFTVTAPDLTKWGAFSDYMDNILSNMNQSMILDRIVKKIQTPLVTLVGETAADLAITSVQHAINPNSVEIAYPVFGLGTVSLFDDLGKTVDQDSFYFLYIKK